MTVLNDTLAQWAAGAVHDPYTLIRRGSRRVLKVAGYAVPQKRQGLSSELAVCLDQDGWAHIDWGDPRREERS